jgi:hypothetical protein
MLAAVSWTRLTGRSCLPRFRNCIRPTRTASGRSSRRRSGGSPSTSLTSTSKATTLDEFEFLSRTLLALSERLGIQTKKVCCYLIKLTKPVVVELYFCVAT